MSVFPKWVVAFAAAPTSLRPLTIALVGALALPVFAQTPASLSIPDKVATPLGTLDFKDGAPSPATTQKLFDNLDLVHAQNVVLNTFQGASTYALREGLRSVGAEDNSVIIFSDLMDSNSLFLTANCDVIYFISIVDLSKGPMVIEVPPGTLGTVDDMWFNWIIDAGTRERRLLGVEPLRSSVSKWPGSAGRPS